MPRPHRSTIIRALGFAFLALLFGCSTPPPAPEPPPSKPVVVPAPPPRPAAAPAPVSKFADEVEWRRATALHIHAVHKKRIFEGRPPHPLKAVVVVQMTVARDGRVQRAEVLRAPDHARHLGPEATRMAFAASPVPVPPAALASSGQVRFTETWLFRQDEQFQLRTLALTQNLN
jgi:protein TonB